jgi:hypothetical protein
MSERELDRRAQRRLAVLRHTVGLLTSRWTRVGCELGMRWRKVNGDCSVLVCPAAGRAGEIHHHQPSLRVQRSKTNEIASMIKHKMISGTHRVESLTMTFMPRTEDSDVIGRVMAAITASRSAAMVILVSVRAR